MAGAEPSIEETKQELITSLDQSRREMVIDFDEVGDLFNIPGQIRDSFHDDQWKWLGVVLAAGVATGFFVVPQKGNKPSNKNLSRLVKSPQAPSKKSMSRVLFGSLVRGGFDLARPALTKMAREAVEKWAKGPPDHQ